MQLKIYIWTVQALGLTQVHIWSYLRLVAQCWFFLQVPRLLEVVEDDSLFFKVVSPVDACNKVAPGMALTFTVLFTPQENKVHFFTFPGDCVNM